MTRACDEPWYRQAINVEAEERDPSSLWNWIKRLIQTRRNCAAFGLGDRQLFYAKNRSVLAFCRHREEQTLLVVANLSRFVQLARLSLDKFVGASLVEVFGREPFPVVTSEPYFLTLGSHAFYWFEVKR